jgi:hypothetical protein
MSQTQAPFDTRWAIAAETTTKKLEALADETIIDAIRWRVLEGSDGFAAIVAGDGPADDYENHVAAFATKLKRPVFLLDFNDEADAVLEYSSTKARPKRLRIHPAAFLREHGITAPGYEPRERARSRTVLIVEGSTPEATRKASPDKSLTFDPHPRGTLVRGDVKIGGEELIKKLGGRVFLVRCHGSKGSFRCCIDERGKKSQLFQPTGEHQYPDLYDYVDNVLGERTLDGILRVLSIPKEHLAP